MAGTSPQELLGLALVPEENDAGATTVRGYLIALLSTLWREAEGFSGKRPFGNGGWQDDLYKPMVVAGVVPGTLDEDGCLDTVDDGAADELVLAAISALGS